MTVGSGSACRGCTGPCGECDFCQRGMENLCPHARFTGFSVDGGFGEYLLAETQPSAAAAGGLSDEQAAPLCALESSATGR